MSHHIFQRTVILICNDLNPDSVGQPRDGDNRPSYGIYDLESKEANIRRIDYDITKVAGRLEENKFPQESVYRLKNAC